VETGQRDVLFGRTYPDVPLENPPIARVIGQLRFGALSALQPGNPVPQAFISALASNYPYTDHGAGTVLQFTVGEAGVQQSPYGFVWRMYSADRSTVVALTESTLALETTQYHGRKAFCADLHEVVSALLAAVPAPPAFSRLGLRYTNRLASPESNQLQNMVQRELLGVFGAVHGGSAHVAHSLAQTLFTFDDSDGQLLAQWGYLPGGASIDPSMQAIDQPSWLLDMDAFTNLDGVLSADTIGSMAKDCAERAYTFFRWAVTDDYLRAFGGSP
jgi:uncharacterized protein (TIGR04255 family)